MIDGECEVRKQEAGSIIVISSGPFSERKGAVVVGNEVVCIARNGGS